MKAAILAMSLCAALIVPGALETALGDFKLARARAQLETGFANQPKPLPFENAVSIQRDLESTLRHSNTPRPQVLNDMAGLYLLRLHTAYRSPSVYRFTAALSENYFRQALAERPVNGRAWANIALLRILTGDQGPVYQQALATALRQAPSDYSVGRILLLATLPYEDKLPPATMAFARQVYAQQSEPAQKQLQPLLKQIPGATARQLVQP
jgi:hypothetical protein